MTRKFQACLLEWKDTNVLLCFLYLVNDSHLYFQTDQQIDPLCHCLVQLCLRCCSEVYCKTSSGSHEMANPPRELLPVFLGVAKQEL